LFEFTNRVKIKECRAKP